MSSRLSGPPPHAQGARSPAVAPAGEPTRLTRGTWLRRVSVPISSPVAGESTVPSCGGPAFRRFRPAPRRLWLLVFGCFAHGFILASGGVYWGWWPVPATSHGEGATPLGMTPGPASPSGLPLPTPAGNGRLCAAGTPGFMSVLRPGRPTPWCRCRPDPLVHAGTAFWPAHRMGRAGIPACGSLYLRGHGSPPGLRALPHELQ